MNWYLEHVLDCADHPDVVLDHLGQLVEVCAGLLRVHLLHLLLHGRQLRERARQLRVLLGRGERGQRPGQRPRRVGKGAAVVVEGLSRTMEAAELVIQLVHHFALLLEPEKELQEHCNISGILIS